MKKIVVGMATVAVVGLGSVFLTDSVHANTVSELETKQEKVAGDRSAVKEKLSKAEAQIADVLFDIKDLNAKIDQMKSALKENQKSLDKTSEDIKKTEKEINELETEIEIIEKRIEERTEKLKERIASYQQNGGDIAYLDVIFGAKDFSEFISRVSAVTTITNADVKLVEEQEEDKEEVIAIQEKVAKKLDELEDKQSDLKANEEQIKKDKETVEKSKKEEQKKEKELTALKANLESEDSSLAALEDQIRQDINAASNPVATTESDSGSLTTLASANSNNDNSSNNNSVSSNNNNSNSSNSGNSSSNKSKAKKPASSAPAYTGGGGSAISAGQQFVGKSTYVFGAKNPGAGQFDCSGFVSWAYDQEGVSLPRSTAGMRSSGTKISYSQAKAGDLVFFDTYKKDGHVGIYLGGGKFLGAQSSTGVAVANMSSGYWKDNFSGHVRRVK